MPIMPTMPTVRSLRSRLRPPPPRSPSWPAGVTVRAAVPADAAALRRLAILDEQDPIVGDALVAEVGGELWAALSLDDGHAIADPFRPSGELALLLAQRAHQIQSAMPAPATHGRPTLTSRAA